MPQGFVLQGSLNKVVGVAVVALSGAAVVASSPEPEISGSSALVEEAKSCVKTQ